MRIHAIRTFNLNSLYGTQRLDLDRDLAGHSLFLIRGETGAGKSTILDAISLALFARTARLADTSTRGGGVDDADPRLVLSDGTGEGYAEVDFSVLDGGIRHYWRARWSVARARGKADGTLQKPKRTLIRLSDRGDELQTLVSSDRQRDFETPFETALCGLGYDDFSRTVMLAQGQFQQFLRSNHKERAELLERLTGTQEYAAIGMRASERKRQMDAEVAAIEAKIGGVVVLTEAQIAELHTEQSVLNEGEQAAKARSEEIRVFTDWLQRDADLRAEKMKQDDRLQEAVAAVAVFEPERARLALHQRTEPAAMQLEKWRAAQHEHARRTEAHRQGEQAVARATEVATEKGVVRAARTTELEQIQQQALEMQPQIAAAREAWSHRSAVTLQFSVASESLARKKAEQARAEADYKELLTQLVELQGTLQSVRDGLDDLAGTEALTGQLPVWRDRIATWKLAGERSEALQLEIQDLLKKEAEGQEDLVRLRKALSDVLTRQEQAVDELQKAEQETRALTGGLAVPTFRDEREALVIRRREQIAAFEKLIAQYDTGKTWHEERSTTMHLLEVADESMTDLKARHAREGAALAKLLEEQERLLEVREQLGLILEIVERRGALTDGEACPLCGSLEHPYRTGAAVPPDDSHYIAERERAKTFLDGLREEIRIATEKEKRTALDIRGKTDHIERFQTQAHDLSTRLDELQEHIADSLASALLRELKPVNGWTDTEAVLVRSEVAEALADDERDLKLLQKRVDQESAAREQLAKIRLDAAAAEAEVRRVEGVVASYDESRLALQARANEADGQLLEVAEALRQEFSGLAWLTWPEPWGHTVASEAWQRASERLATWQALRSQLEQLDTEVRQREATVEGARSALEVGAKSLLELQQTLVGLQNALVAAESTVAGHLDGRSPDDVAHDWNRRVEDARQLFTTAEKDWNAAQIALETARTAELSAKSELTTALQSLLSSERLIHEALAEVNLPDVAALELARLSAADLNSLSERSRAVDSELRQAEGAAKAVGEQVTASREARPASLAQDAVLDDLQEEGRALVEEIRELVTRLGQLQTTLTTNDERSASLGDLQAQLAARRVEAERWKLIDELIGTADGSKFRKLAQGYHLVELADFANLRLEKLSDRYRLRVRLSEHGAPTMDFMVQDAHQADRERPLTTLSGGETFMVSLALALALSDFRAVRMPIETVLIDEGFGTLDPVTLNTVVQALENLQSSTGARVGIISHVSGLSERIGGRVLVKRESAGRSTIVVEKGD